MNILILSYNNFPDGDAGSVREYAIGKLFARMGNTVFFIGMGTTESNVICSYKEFKYTSLRINQNQPSIGKALVNYAGYKLRLKRFLSQYTFVNKIECIVVIDIPLNALLFIKRLAKKNNIKLIHDSVEWYSPEQFKLRKLAPEYILKTLNNKFFIDKSFKVIAISKYLEKHFKARGIDTVRIPVIMDVSSLSWEKRTREDKLTILYAGSPGKKDYLKEVIEGMALLEEYEFENIELRLIGITFEQLLADSNIDKNALIKIKNKMKILGRVPRNIVLMNLEEADFTVLMRSPIQRYAKAGFPTKVIESLASATPVILNITSDLGDYINDMEQGLIMPDCSAVAFSEAVRRGLGLTFEQRCGMYNKARQCAEKFFHYEEYCDLLESIT
jgi:glycosyltransferase involved in cell wall biosynthesis